MRRVGRFKFLVAASMLMSSLGSAGANATTTYYSLTPGLNAYGSAEIYETSSSAAAANDSQTASYGGSSAKGGLCYYQSNGCNTAILPPTAHQGQLTGTTAPYSIQMTLPSGLTQGNYLLELQVTGLSTTVGDIYDVYVNGSNFGSTPFVLSNGQSSAGQLSGFVSGAAGTVITIYVVDMLQQEQGATATQYKNLCTSLGGSLATCNSVTSGISTSYDPSEDFTLAAEIQTSPEPATLSLFAGSAALIGFLRRRRSQATV